jgi:excisionase family DNA binding protein
MDEPEGVVADDKLLLRIEEAAKRLGIGRSLMYRLVLSGQVQSVSLGRLRRVPTEVLREYIERLRVEGSGQSPAA